jgi:glycosyltransferase involved in cell wall biosynthesis
MMVCKGLGRGGTERLVVDLAYEMQRRFDVEVAYLLPQKRALVPELERGGVPVHHVGPGPGWVRRLRSVMLQRSIDVMHAHSPVAGALLRLPRHRIPIVYTEHNVWTRYHRATRLANALTFGRNQHVFAVSDEVLASIQSSWFGRRCQNAETLRHGLPSDFAARWSSDSGVRDELGIAPDTPLIVSVANFKPFKGHQHLLRAAALVRLRAPDARFVLVGVGPEEPRMKELAAELVLDGSVVFAGFREDAPRLMAAADVFVLPSEHEGFPIALLEAMALGRAVVATNVDGIPEAARDGVDAVLVGPRNPDALAAAIVTLLEDPLLRDRLGFAARRRAATFDIRKTVARIEEVYEEVLSENGRTNHLATALPG